MKLIVSTAPEDAVAGIAEALLGEKLVACVNALPGATSRYWWNGRIEEARETVLLMKTTPELAAEAVRRLCEAHPYDVPEAIVLDIEGGHPPYLEWIADSTRQSS